MLGILLIDKPAGWTSHDVVAKLRGKLGTKRIGHSGTLDPLATGLLVLAVGPATRFLQYLPLENKRYRAWFRFGHATNTQDAEGEVISTSSLPPDLYTAIQQHLPDFRGSIRQIPPMYSAVKVAGSPLYKMARRGVEVERDARTVQIDTFELISLEGSDAEFVIECSGGTYVRTLAHDLGAAIGCGAHVRSLVRERVGKFELANATSIEAVSPSDLVPLTEALQPMPFARLSPREVALVRQGQTIAVRKSQIGPVVLLDPQGQTIGIALPGPGGFLQPKIVLPAEHQPTAGVAPW